MSGETSMGAGRVVAGRYELLAPIGSGGMGTVWLASDRVLGRDVAVKEVTYPPYLSVEERRLMRERTMREARAAARFEHPRVTTVHDVVEERGEPWIVMEHVRSRTLTQVVRDSGPLRPDQAARVGLDVLSALQAAHRAGIVHRDVKPGNVLLDDQGQAWLTDFGIATSSGDSSITGEGLLLGSPSYMAPELARGERIGPPADLWSLGATLYLAVEGRPPFDRGEPMATLVAVTLEEPTMPQSAGALEPVLRGLLEKDPARRMTAETAGSALQRVARSGGGGQEAREEPPARAPSAADAESAARGNEVERFDVDELAGMLASATIAVARSAARSAAARKERARAGHGTPTPDATVGTGPPPPPAGAAGGQAQRPVRGGRATARREERAAARREERAAARREERGAARVTQAPPASRSDAARPHRRFRKRWVAVPLVMMVLGFIVVLAGLGALVWFVFQI